MMSVLLIINTCVTVALVILILLQKTDPSSGGMFGGTGSSQTVVRNPLAKPTAYLAAIFMVLTLALAYLNKGGEHKADSVMADIAALPAPAALQPAMVGQAIVGQAIVGDTVSVTTPEAVTPTAPAVTVSPSA
jgi:preprotein translocase subunit SecG